MDLFSLREHPAASAFPMLSGKELDDLVSDIKETGLRVPIDVWDAGGEWLVLDGRNRLKACQLAGVQPRYVVCKTKDPVKYVLSINLHRRHLDESQRSMVAGRLANLGVGRPEKGSIEPISLSTERAAKDLHVGKESVKRARKVLADGAPELIAAVDHGDVAVSAAAAITDLPKEEQVRVVAEGRVKEEAAKKRKKKERASPEENRGFTPELEGEHLWDEASALMDVDDFIGRVIHEWKGPSLEPLIERFQFAISRLEKANARRQAS